MSESNTSSYGESASSYSSKKSYSRSSESAYSNGESSYHPHSSPAKEIKSTTEENKPNIKKVKETLKNIEAYVSNELSLEEKEIFIKTYRKIIIENEKEVVAYPNTNFFISKFEENTELFDDLKEKIIKSLYAYHQLEREQKSKLKYW